MNAAVFGMRAVTLLAVGLLAVTIENSAATEEIRAIKRWPGTIEATRLNVRSGHVQNYDIVYALNRCDEFVVVDQVLGWVRL